MPRIIGINFPWEERRAGAQIAALITACGGMIFLPNAYLRERVHQVTCSHLLRMATCLKLTEHDIVILPGTTETAEIERFEAIRSMWTLPVLLVAQEDQGSFYCYQRPRLIDGELVFDRIN